MAACFKYILMWTKCDHDFSECMKHIIVALEFDMYIVVGWFAQLAAPMLVFKARKEKIGPG